MCAGRKEVSFNNNRTVRKSQDFLFGRFRRSRRLSERRRNTQECNENQNRRYQSGAIKYVHNPRFVRGIFRKGFPHERYIMTELFEQVAQVLRDVVIEQKSHSVACAI